METGLVWVDARYAKRTASTAQQGSPARRPTRWRAQGQFGAAQGAGTAARRATVIGRLGKTTKAGPLTSQPHALFTPSKGLPVSLGRVIDCRGLRPQKLVTNFAIKWRYQIGRDHSTSVSSG